MKTFMHKTIVFALIVMGMVLTSSAQRVIKGLYTVKVNPLPE